MAHAPGAWSFNHCLKKENISMAQAQNRHQSSENKEFEEKVVEIKRVSKTVKGGRKMAFTALVVLGNKQGKVGIGLGKANEVKEAVRKGVDQARKHIRVVVLKGNTIPFESMSKFKAAAVFLKPASEGTGLIAGGATRIVLNLAGVKDILTKQHGSANPYNNAIATFNALQQISEFAKINELRQQDTANRK
jgi:small subunit ribosomal protein S5